MRIQRKCNIVYDNIMINHMKIVKKNYAISTKAVCLIIVLYNKQMDNSL